MNERAEILQGPGWHERSDDRTFDDIRSFVSDAIRAAYPPANDSYLYVADLTNEWAVYESDDGLRQVSYDIDDSGAVRLGDPIEVARQTSYCPVARSQEPEKVEPVIRHNWSLRENEVPMLANMSIRSASPESTDVVLVGWPSTTGDAYDVTDWLGEYRETINAGAFGKTLKESDYIPLLQDHKGDVLAAWHQGNDRTMDLAEDKKGLRNEAALDVVDNATSRTVVSGVRRGDLSKMSFAFQGTKEDWNVNFTERGVNELKLFDVSIVKFPANARTSIEIRSDMRDLLGREGVALFYSARSAYDGYMQTREIPEEAEPIFEQTMRALRALDERMAGDLRYQGIGRARTFVVVDLINQVRSGKVLSSANQQLLQTAYEGLSQADNATVQVSSAIAGARSAITTVLGAPDTIATDGKVSNQSGINTAPINDGHPVLPADGAGIRDSSAGLKYAMEERRLLEQNKYKNVRKHSNKDTK